ncbi:MAG: adenylate/guanylate cyclase domain-containing protein [Ideonella sp.]|nr:adenylate/guanylate cyclase domain-containing protein [Ideonella sp.]
MCETAAGAVARRVAVQTEIAERTAGEAEDCRMRLRIGIHLGDVIEKSDGTVYGDGVNTAARLEAIAEAGGVCAVDAVECAVRHRVAARFEDLGEQALKTWRVRCTPTGCARSSRQRRCLRRPPTLLRANARRQAGDRHAAARQHERRAGAGVLRRRHHRGHHHRASRFRELFVISRNSSFKLAAGWSRWLIRRGTRARSTSPRAACAKVGTRVRITVQLIDAETDRHVRAERRDRDLADIFAIQDEVTWPSSRRCPGASRGRVARPRGAQDA